MRYLNTKDRAKAGAQIRALMIAGLKRKRWTKSNLIAFTQGVFYPGYIDRKFVYVQDLIKIEFHRMVAEGVVYYKPYKTLRLTLDVSQCPEINPRENLSISEWVGANPLAVIWFLETMTNGGSDMPN